MIERKVVQQKIKEYMVQNYVSSTLNRVGHSHTSIQRNPLGERIVISASRPGLIVGNKGANIKKLTKVLKAKFKLENPQVEIDEVKNPSLDPVLVAENIASSLERFGTSRFKGVGYKCMEGTMSSGALGIEVMISGKIPSSRAKRWRFFTGYLKKCGDLSVEGILTAYDVAKLKTGIVGIQVRIMPPGIVLPDRIELTDTLKVEVAEVDASGKVVSDETAAAKAEAEETENLKKIKTKAKPKKKKESKDVKEVKEKTEDLVEEKTTVEEKKVEEPAKTEVKEEAKTETKEETVEPKSDTQ